MLSGCCHDWQSPPSGKAGHSPQPFFGQRTVSREEAGLCDMRFSADPPPDWERPLLKLKRSKRMRQDKRRRCYSPKNHGRERIRLASKSSDRQAWMAIAVSPSVANWCDKRGRALRTFFSTSPDHKKPGSVRTCLTLSLPRTGQVRRYREPLHCRFRHWLRTFAVNRRECCKDQRCCGTWTCSRTARDKSTSPCAKEQRGCFD